MWTVEKDVSTKAVDAAQDFCDFLLAEYDAYLNGLYAENMTPEAFYEWLDDGNRLQVTYGIDGIHIVPLLSKEERHGF